MIARINGIDREVASGAVLADLVDRYIPNSQWVAVVLDGAVVPRSAWKTTPVTDGCTLEVLSPRQGG